MNIDFGLTEMHFYVLSGGILGIAIVAIWELWLRKRDEDNDDN